MCDVYLGMKLCVPNFNNVLPIVSYKTKCFILEQTQVTICLVSKET